MGIAPAELQPGPINHEGVVEPGALDPVGGDHEGVDPGSARLAAPAFYRIGDAVLELRTDHRPLLDSLAMQYGECGVTGAEPGAPRLVCNATQVPGSSLLLLTFEGQPVPNLVDVARGMFWPIRARQCYVEVLNPVPGWRMLVNAEHGGRMLLTCSRDTALVALDEAPPDFVLDSLFVLMQSVQPGVLFVHGASIGVYGSGALFVGRTRHGKSSTALSLASRGHAFLGDDVAAVRVAQRHLIPLRTSAALRPGPLADAIHDQVQACGYTLHAEPDGNIRKLVRVGDLFPSAAAGAVPLRFAFFLDGFADRPTLRPFKPAMADVDRLHAMMVSWLPTPGQQLMRFLEILDLLADLQCFLLEVGPPEDTAVLIEGVMA